MPKRREPMHHYAGEIRGGSGFIHRSAKRGHAADQHQQPPIDELVGALHGDAAREDRGHGRGEKRDRERHPADAADKHGRGEHRDREQSFARMIERLAHFAEQRQTGLGA